MIFAFAIPVLGIAGEIIPVAARQAQRQYVVQQIGIGALGVLSLEPLHNHSSTLK